MKKLLVAAALSFAFASFAAEPVKAAEKMGDKKKAVATEVKTEAKTVDAKASEAKTEAKAVEAKTTETKTAAPAAKPAPKK